MPNTILLVDDNEDHRNLLSCVLRLEGFVVHVADNGQIGLERFMTNDDIDLVITDHNMPVMNGETMLEKIMTSKPGAKAIMTTCSPEMQDKGWLRGTIPILGKPLKMPVFFATIAAQLQPT